MILGEKVSLVLYKQLKHTACPNFHWHNFSYETPRVPTRPGKPEKMRVYLENLELSWNFVKFNKNPGKII